MPCSKASRSICRLCISRADHCDRLLAITLCLSQPANCSIIASNCSQIASCLCRSSESLSISSLPSSPMHASILFICLILASLNRLPCITSFRFAVNLASSAVAGGVGNVYGGCLSHAGRSDSSRASGLLAANRKRSDVGKGFSASSRSRRGRENNEGECERCFRL